MWRDWGDGNGDGGGYAEVVGDAKEVLAGALHVLVPSPPHTHTHTETHIYTYTRTHKSILVAK